MMMSRASLSNNLVLLKIGGRVIEEPQALQQLLALAVATKKHAQQPVLIVHGGGVKISAFQERLGLTPKFIGGKRYTSAAEVELVEMVLAANNQDIVRRLLQLGQKAVGISGVDGGLLTANLLPGLGQVGEPAAVDLTLLQLLLRADYLPVISPISLAASSPDPKSEATAPWLAVNVNADEVAAALAAALKVETLILFSDVPGVQIGGVYQETLARREIGGLIERGEITGGMIPKLRAAERALAEGVRKVAIVGLPALAAVDGAQTIANGGLTALSGTLLT